MASPTTDTPTRDPAARDSPSLPEKEKTADVNGHASPAPEPTKDTTESKTEPKSDSENKPSSDKPDEALVNGKASPTDAATPNGVAAVNGEGDKLENKDAPRDATPAAAAKPEDKPADSAKEEEKASEKKASEEPAAQKEEPKEEPKAESTQENSDVQMTDANEDAAAPTSSKESALEETTEKKASDESKPTAAADTGADIDADADADVDADADTIMTDDKPADKPAEEPVKPKAEDSQEAPPSSDVDVGSSGISQLAIDSKSPINTSIEVSMTDVLGSKNAREREEEEDDEPLAKRAKTEPKDEGGAITATPKGENAGTPDRGLGRLASLQKWNDSGLQEKKISPFQRREIRKVIGRVKKTKHGGHFRDAVAKLWPALGESYLARIENPMDLAEIDRGLRDANSPYITFGDVQKDLRLIFENTLTFNGALHDVTDAAFYAVRNVWQEAVTIPDDEPARPKSVAKPKPPREPRVLPGGPDNAARRQSSGPASSPPPPVNESKPKPQAAEPVVDRRGSTATDGDRPKRTVRAPKPKDIDYTTKPSRKKLKPELQFCDEVLAELMHPKNSTLNMWFLDAVDAEGLNIPDYYSIIKKPMDLGKVSRMVNAGEIANAKEFDKTIRLVFTNCYQFNGPPEQGNPVSMVAKQLEDLYNQQLKGKDAWLARYAKANAPAASASNASDDDEEDDSEEEEAGAPAVDNSKEIQELKAKLEEESSKLNRMFASGTPQALIDCQKVIVDTVQQALYKAAQNQGGEGKAKHQDKSAKKSSKPSKSKAAGSAPARKASSHAPPPKKSGVAKKPAPKKSLSAADKDQIASAINDLEYPHLDRAIDIIKRDTGQNENNEGELELDIDQLSNEALIKLWELCKKVLPGFGKDSNATAKSPEVNRAVPAKQAPKSASKPKKNKPMSAQEQEARIAQLTAIQQLYKPGQEPSDDVLSGQAPGHHDDSSDDSDSEEE
ncbi:sporulation transcription factor [Trichoderma evansii]